MKDLPSPLRVGVWGAVSYIVGKAVLGLAALAAGFFAMLLGIGIIAALVFACQWWPWLSHCNI